MFILTIICVDVVSKNTVIVAEFLRGFRIYFTVFVDEKKYHFFVFLFSVSKFNSYIHKRI
jgi:hypothetical protein